MPARRTTWPCGHTGKGRSCARCHQERQAACRRAEAATTATTQRRADKAAWEATFAADPIDLRVLQTRERVIKARELLGRLAGGAPLGALGGKRWQGDRGLASVPIGMGYRLVLRDVGGELRPVACMTHEAYNGLKPGAFRDGGVR